MFLRSALASPKAQATSFHHVSACIGCGPKKGLLVALVSSLSVLLPWEKPSGKALYQPNLKSSVVMHRKGVKSVVFGLGVGEP